MHRDCCWRYKPRQEYPHPETSRRRKTKQQKRANQLTFTLFSWSKLGTRNLRETDRTKAFQRHGKLGDYVLNILDGQTKTYLSIDSVIDAENFDDNTLLLPEYLNMIEEGSLPPHKLVLKKNAVVILIRNLSQEDVECQILTENHASERHIISRINNTIDYHGMLQLNRKQFPLKLAFAMTINKSQGQKFEQVGLNLEYEVFEHGQLCVALSRARSWDSVK